jgi:DNA-binding LytR/AlgR family response regulator
MKSIPTALLAEDEPVLAAALQRMLEKTWPELQVVAVTGDGISACELARQHLPDLLFLDIRMPGKSGLEVAAEVLDEWPGDGPHAKPAPLVVFVTAYEEFALAAFEQQAADYILKPATLERLAQTVVRLQARYLERQRVPALGELATLLAQVQALHASPAADTDLLTEPALLDTLHLGIGNTVRLVRLSEVLYCEATDKYLNVVTTAGEGLIRLSLRELIQRVAPGALTQVHRSIIVNPKRIESATRDDAGHMTLALRDCNRALPVSRAFAHLFRAM